MNDVNNILDSLGILISETNINSISEIVGISKSTNDILLNVNKRVIYSYPNEGVVIEKTNSETIYYKIERDKEIIGIFAFFKKDGTLEYKCNVFLGKYQQMADLKKSSLSKMITKKIIEESKLEKNKVKTYKNNYINFIDRK